MNFQNWKRNKVKHYGAVHQWLKRTYGRATYCSNDKQHKAGMYEWANISGEYKKDITDWMQLCPSCHRIFDYKDEYREMIRKRNMGNGYHNKELKQLDSLGRVIKKWKSSVSVEKSLNILRSSISNVLAGRAETAGGWRWSR